MLPVTTFRIPIRRHRRLQQQAARVAKEMQRRADLYQLAASFTQQLRQALIALAPIPARSKLHAVLHRMRVAAEAQNDSTENVTGLTQDGLQHLLQ